MLSPSESVNNTAFQSAEIGTASLFKESTDHGLLNIFNFLDRTVSNPPFTFE